MERRRQIKPGEISEALAVNEWLRKLKAKIDRGEKVGEICPYCGARVPSLALHNLSCEKLHREDE